LSDGLFVILSEAKEAMLGLRLLRFAQDDTIILRPTRSSKEATWGD